MVETKKAHIYTVSGLTRDVRMLLDTTFPEVWVEGEISNFRVPSSGHCYFSLKDSGSMLKCVLFKRSSSRLRFNIEDGMHVLCFGRLGVYEKQGQYQLYVDIIEPKGKGALYIAFEQLKEKLQKEGLFDEKHKKSLPFLPGRIGIVTSGTGAALKDILKVLGRRFSGVGIMVYPVKVQGDDAKYEIAEAIKAFNDHNKHNRDPGGESGAVDVLIVGRGGGSLEDLWAFNEEIVARAIFESDIPVISAVGHEIDFTISDFVSDRRAATPSAAAELAVPEKTVLMDRIGSLNLKLDSTIKNIFDRSRARLSELSESYVLKEPVNVILQLEQQVDEYARRIFTEAEHYTDIKKSMIDIAAGRLRALSPLSVLERGYSITFKDGKTVKNARALKPDDRIVTRFAEGRSASRVESVKSD